MNSFIDTPNACQNAFDIPIGSWQQAAQERSKWRGLINKRAAHYDRERKANTNWPTSDSLTLTFFTCN